MSYPFDPSIDYEKLADDLLANLIRTRQELRTLQRQLDLIRDGHCPHCSGRLSLRVRQNGESGSMLSEPSASDDPSR